MLCGERINSWICFTATVQPQYAYVPLLTLPHPPLPRHFSVILISCRRITQSRASWLCNSLIVCWVVERLNCSSETCPRQFLNCCLVSLNCLYEFSSRCWNSVSCLWDDFVPVLEPLWVVAAVFVHFASTPEVAFESFVPVPEALWFAATNFFHAAATP